LTPPLPAPAAVSAPRSRPAGLAPWADLLLAAALGAAHSLPLVATWAWPAQLLCVGLLVWRLARATALRGGVFGWAFGTAWFVCATWWLFISMHRYGGLPSWMAAAGVFALGAGMALLPALACGAFARWRRGAALPDAGLFAALWLLAELARGMLFTGFPWGASGYAHVDSPLAALAPWVGVYGIGAVAAAIAALLVRPWITPTAFAIAPPNSGPAAVGKPWRHAAAALAVLGALAIVPVPPFTQATGTLSVALLQGNVPQDEKFSMRHLPQALHWTREQLLAANADLVVGAETVIPLLPHQLDPLYWQPLLEHFRQPGRAALVGLPLGDEQLGYTNSAAGIAAHTAALPEGYYRYDKHHLVPFGELIPPLFKWFVRMMDIPLGDFNRGALAAPSFEVKGERVAPNICYEDLFGEELAARFTDVATAPTILANLSNIGWFGESIAVGQHLNISRMRTLELQLPMLRATNTGATAVIDHRGQVTHALAPHTVGVLQGRVQGRSGVTPFARWAGRLGLWPLVGAALLLCAALARRRGPA
jgi:apolipoprotein N-acyltransferase